MSSFSLRDVLVAALAKLPCQATYSINVLVTAPKKHNDLYPFVKSHPKCYLQDILVLLSEVVDPSTGSDSVFVAAVDVSVYHIPSTQSALIHISKVDTTGQGASSSCAATIVKTLLHYYINPVSRPLPVKTIWVHLFARAQGQYLFPNSSEHPKKHPLSDIKLCSWWKYLLGSAVDVWKDHLEGQGRGEDWRLEPYYVLPGLSEAEASRSLQAAFPSKDPSRLWKYGHPYAQIEIPFPCPTETSPSVAARSIPSFDDDPKTRFMDELAYTTDAHGVVSPRRKRARTDEGNKTNISSATDDVTAHDSELHSISTDEFWERMGFRQECVSGAITAFFALGFHSPSVKFAPEMDERTAPTAQPGQVGFHMFKRVMTALVTGQDFSSTERSIKATEAIESLIKSLCTNVIADTAETSQVDRSTTPERSLSAETASFVPQTPQPQKRQASKHKVKHIDVQNDPPLSLEHYNKYIHAVITVDNPVIAKADPQEVPTQINTLVVRKKKKKAP